MKHIKTFEGLFDFLKKKEKQLYCQYKEGDYVVGVNSRYINELKDYVENNAGLIYHIADGPKYNHVPYIYVKYNKILSGESVTPGRLSKHEGDRLMFFEQELKYATPDQIEQYQLEEYSNKYNI